MNDQEMILYIEKHGLLSNPRAMTAKKHHSFMEILKDRTSFLDDAYEKVKNTARLMCFVEGIEEVKTCDSEGCDGVCGITANTKNGVSFAKFCSYRCSSANSDVRKEKIKEFFSNETKVKERKEKTKRTLQEKAKRMGFDNPEQYTHSMHFPDVVEKTKKTHENNWDGGHPMRDKDFVDKRKGEFLATYGVEHPMHIEEVKIKSLKAEDGSWRITSTETQEKIKKTFHTKYGGHPMRNEDVKMRMKENSREKYGVDYPNQSHIPPESLEILSNKGKLEEVVNGRFLSDVADEIGVHASTVQRACASLGVAVQKFRSKAEAELESIISSLGVDVVVNVRLFENKEVDLYTPEKKVGIEFNGMYWHSEKQKSRGYHQDKSLTYMKNGVQIIHVWEDDWLNPLKKGIVIEKIKSKLGVSDRERVFARKTEAKVLNGHEVKPFYNANHIQGHIDASTHIGLVHNGSIVAAMSFRRLEGGVWDLCRYATSANVVGGMSKCLSFFKKGYEWSEIFTFAHLDYSSGVSYELVGFDRVGVTPPNLWYMKEGEWVRMGRRRFMKKKLPDILPLYDDSLTEAENMNMNGYVRIYDAGSIKYTMKNA